MNYQRPLDFYSVKDLNVNFSSDIKKYKKNINSCCSCQKLNCISYKCSCFLNKTVCTSLCNCLACKNSFENKKEIIKFRKNNVNLKKSYCKCLS